MNCIFFKLFSFDITLLFVILYYSKREVPQANYLMHVVHCARNMTVCPVCGDAVPKAHLKEHRQKQHSLGKHITYVL